VPAIKSRDDGEEEEPGKSDDDHTVPAMYLGQLNAVSTSCVPM